LLVVAILRGFKLGKGGIVLYVAEDEEVREERIEKDEEDRVDEERDKEDKEDNEEEGNPVEEDSCNIIVESPDKIGRERKRNRGYHSKGESYVV